MEGIVLGREEVVLHHVEADGAVFICLVARVAGKGRVANQGAGTSSLVPIVEWPLAQDTIFQL